MIYTINAIALAFIAAIWSKQMGLNVLIAILYLLLAILNCALAAPFIYHIVELL